jgi:Hypoxia induced protein conserved region
MAKGKKAASDPLSEDAVRAGVTGHHVRYVLFFGLAGAILAFIGLAIYLGFDRLQQRISNALAHDPGTLIRKLAPYAAVVVGAVVAAVLLLGLWNMVAGRSESTSQMGMRFRVVAQFVIVCAIMAMFYLAAS